MQESDVDIVTFDEGEEFVCELASGLTVPIRGTDEQIDEMRALLHEGRFVSSEMTVGIAKDVISANAVDDAVHLPPGEIILAPRFSRRAKRRTLKGSTVSYEEDRDDDNGRRTAEGENMYEGTKQVLVVRVTDSDGRVHSDNAKTISNKIFGTYGDVANAKSQFSACSYGKFQLTNEYDDKIPEAAPGVIEVDIPIPLKGNDRRAVRSAAIRAARSKLGFQLPGPFHHVMFVLEGCYQECGWAAYAYVNSWLSVYQGDNYKYVGVQLHELGHNLNLSYQLARGGLAWYNENSYDTVVWNSNHQSFWSGKIIGIADYKNNPNRLPVVVKLESGGPNDLFVGFNRAKGINRHSADARDEVTVVLTGNDGLGYSQSYLEAKLSQGKSHLVQDWRGLGVELTINVNEINTRADPAYADILVVFGDTMRPTEEPTEKPSAKPSARPTGEPTKTPSASPTVGRVIGPTCGDSVCDKDEHATNCPSDCLQRQIQTTFDFNLGSRGVMFTVEAKRSLVISSFAINSNSRGDGYVKVYTRKGGYTDHIQDSGEWVLIYDKPEVTHARRGHPTYLGDLAEGVMVSEGKPQSFYISSTRGLVYKSGRKEGSPYTIDESLVIYEGIGINGEFSGETFSPRVFGGIIWYNVVDSTLAPTSLPTLSPVVSFETCGNSVCGVNEDSESCPGDCVDKELETTFNFSLGSDGVMFALKALRDISISSLVINAMSRGQGSVKVYIRNGNYSGHEQSNNGWVLIYDNPTLTHDRRGRRTELGNFDNAIYIEGDTTKSFFVTSSNGLVYQEGKKEGEAYASDESLVIYEGIGTTGEFSGTTFSPRVFGGIIRYDAN
ncbi:hypothetical protein ACHAWF_015504 [Thalassiosira exigua]